MRKILEELGSRDTIAIGGHVRPDGDCVGSCMGMYLYLKKALPDAQIDVYLEKPADIFDCIHGIEAVRTDCSKDCVYDVFIVLDTSKERLGDAEKYFRTAKKTINVDHHISNASGCGDVNYCKPAASSASELVYELLEEKYMDAEIAKALYLGIVHDTGVFQYSSTSPETMRIAGELMKTGIPFSRIIDESFYQKTYLQNQVMGRVLAESILLQNGTCIIGYMRRRDMDFYGVEGSDLDGIVSQLRLTKGVEVAIFIYETETQTFKVSLRSNGKVDVSKVAVFFGGGGHTRAAGCDLHGSMYDVINNITAEIERQLTEEDNA